MLSILALKLVSSHSMLSLIPGTGEERAKDSAAARRDLAIMRVPMKVLASMMPIIRVTMDNSIRVKAFDLKCLLEFIKISI